MKLTWLVPDDRGGGVISVAVSCVRQAQAAGHEAILLMLLPSEGWLSDHQDISIETLNKSDFDRDSPRAIFDWLEKHRPDVIVLNGCGQADGLISYLPAWLRCVYAVHDTAPIYWQQAVAAQDDLDAIVAVSETVAQKFAAKIHVSEKLRVIHNGSVFPPAPNLAAPRADNLIFLGGDIETKGAHDLLRLWPRLVNQGFTGSLHWFGKLQDSFRRRVEALPQALGRIHCRGRTSRQAVFNAAAESKVLLMLSRVEPFGMVTIEAMSMGCIPVAWDIDTGTKEIVPSDSGFFAPLGDDAQLAKQVWLACKEHVRLAPTQVLRARDHFSENEMWQRGYEPLLRQLDGLPPRQSRTQSGKTIPDYMPPVRRFQRLPWWMRQVARQLLGRLPRLGYWLRDCRGK